MKKIGTGTQIGIVSSTTLSHMIPVFIISFQFIGIPVHLRIDEIQRFIIDCQIILIILQIDTLRFIKQPIQDSCSIICILEKAGVNPDTRVKDLTDAEEQKLRDVIDNYIVEGDLRRQTALDIKRLSEIGCYRGMRHRKGLPVRGQRSKTNARTRKGPKKTIANKKK